MRGEAHCEAEVESGRKRYRYGVCLDVAWEGGGGLWVLVNWRQIRCSSLSGTLIWDGFIVEGVGLALVRQLLHICLLLRALVRLSLGVSLCFPSGLPSRSVGHAPFHDGRGAP